jgi:hypothetical protein
MEYLGLLFEVVFFFVGLYVYLLSRGMIKVSDPELAKQFERAKKKFGWGIRLLSLALMAIMLLNIFLHIQALWSR